MTTPELVWLQDEPGLSSESPKVWQNLRYPIVQQFPRLISFVSAVQDGIFGPKDDRETLRAMSIFLRDLWHQAKFSICSLSATFNKENKSVCIQAKVEDEMTHFHNFVLQNQSDEDNIIACSFESNEGDDFLLILPNESLSISAAKFIFENVKVSYGLWSILKRLGVQGQNCLAKKLKIPCLGTSRFLTGVHGSWLSLLSASELSDFLKHVMIKSGRVYAASLNMKEWIRGIIQSKGEKFRRNTNRRVTLRNAPFRKQMNFSPDYEYISHDANDFRMCNGSYYIIHENQEEFISLVPPARTTFFLTERSFRGAIKGGIQIGLGVELEAEGVSVLTRGPEFDESQSLTAQHCVILNLAMLNEVEVATETNKKPELDEKFSNLSHALMRKGFRITGRSSFYQAFAVQPDSFLREFTKFEGSHRINTDKLAFKRHFIFPREYCQDPSSLYDTEGIISSSSPNETEYLITVMGSPVFCRLVIYLVDGADNYYCSRMMYDTIQLNRIMPAQQEYDVSDKLGGWIH